LLVCSGEPSTLPDGTRVRTIPALVWPLRDLVLWLELRKINRERPVDFLQVQNDVFVVLAVLAKLTGFRVFYDAQLVEQDYWTALAARSPREIVSSKVLPLAERVLCRISERISVLSQRDRSRLEELHRLPPGKVLVVPISPRRPPQTTTETSGPGVRPIVLFLGSYAHRPNADAITIIEKEIRPRVLRKAPDTVFRIVGNGLPVDALRARGLEAYANVDEVAPFIDAATICVAPVRVGSGVRIKLVEYMSRGKAVVAMTPALEGLPVRPGIDLLVADDLDRFADDVVALLKDEALRHRIGMSGFERIRDLMGEEAAATALSRFYPPS
jgi:glycosyltransferase involved in cell wall biosynthesis